MEKGAEIKAVRALTFHNQMWHLTSRVTTHGKWGTAKGLHASLASIICQIREWHGSFPALLESGTEKPQPDQ